VNRYVLNIVFIAYISEKRNRRVLPLGTVEQATPSSISKGRCRLILRDVKTSAVTLARSDIRQARHFQNVKKTDTAGTTAKNLDFYQADLSIEI
jgi:hypothetical protein